jgi:hypothetical protein
VVALNFHPASKDAFNDGWLPATDGARLMANALVYSTKAEPVTTVRARKNDPAPGIADGIYKGFLVPSISVTNNFVAGAASPGGGVANGAAVGPQTFAGWLATVKTSAGSVKQIFNGPLGSPQPGLKTGDPAPGPSGPGIPGVTFGGFKDPVFAGDATAFIATLKGAVTSSNRTGIWFHAGGSTEYIARAGDPAPGTSGAVFKSFTSLALVTKSEGGFFTATLAPGVGDTASTNNRGLWGFHNGSVSLIIRTGMPLVGGTSHVKYFKAITSVSKSPGAGRYNVAGQTIDVQVTFADGSVTDGAFSAYGDFFVGIVAGNPLPFGYVPIKLGLSSRPKDSVAPVAVLTLAKDSSLGVTSANNVELYDAASGVVIGRKGDNAPDALGSRSLDPFKSFKDPVTGLVSGSTVLAFPAAIDSGVSNNNTGLWTAVENGPAASANLLAREGDEPVGAPGTLYKSFPSVAILDQRGPIFTAKFASGTKTVTNANDDAFYATFSDGQVHLVFREGDTVAGKPLKHFKLLGAISGSPGQRRAFAVGDPNPEVIWLGTFLDGSTAILTTTIP